MTELLKGFNPNTGPLLAVMHERRASFYCLPIDEVPVEVLITQEERLSASIPVYEQVITTQTDTELELVAQNNSGKDIYAITRPKLGSDRDMRSAAIKIRPEDIPYLPDAKKSTEKNYCIEIGESRYFQVYDEKLPSFNTHDKTLSHRLDLYLHESELKVKKFLAEQENLVAA
jgi:hypothetical protein